MKKILAILMAMIMVMSVTVVLADGVADKDTQPKVRVIIGFTDMPSQADKDTIRGCGGDIKHSYTIINAIAAKLPEQAIDKIEKNPRVTYVEMDAKMYALDAELDNSWGVKHIGAGDVHEYNKGTGVKVAIIDTGINYNHPDLDVNYNGGIGYKEGDEIDPMDDHGHGTHCAGIVAAVDNEEGVIGVAPDAHLYAVKALNQYDDGYYGYVSDIVAGIVWAINNDMQVISMSIGSNSYSQTLESACNNAYESGIVVVAAAGNDYYRRGRAEFDTVDYPARYDSVIAVGATDSNDEKASFSSTGPDVELAAPGVGINSTITGEEYGIKSGTSMACPHVAGTAALVMTAYPEWTNTQVRQQLRDTADDLGAAGFDYWYGYGLVDANEAAPQPSDATPVVDIVNPGEGFTVSGTIVIEADASDDVCVTKVDFYIDDTLLATDIEAPYSCPWDSTNVADGSHIIKATATDTIEQIASDTITVTVDNIDELPTVEITSPAEGATVSGIITIEASASDDRGVSKVDVYIDNTLLATDNTEPYTASWDTTIVADGSYTIKTIATDTAGQNASDTSGVTVDNAAKFMHIASIDMSTTRIKLNGWYTYATATVTIVDADGPVEGATVEGHWSGLTNDIDSESTADGVVALESDQVKNVAGTFTFTVDNVEHSELVYDESASEETSDSITV